MTQEQVVTFAKEKQRLFLVFKSAKLLNSKKKALEKYR